MAIERLYVLTMRPITNEKKRAFTQKGEGETKMLGKQSHLIAGRRVRIRARD